MTTIRLTPDQLDQEAGTMLTRKDEIIDGLNAVKSQINNLTADEWQGMAASNYADAINQMVPEMIARLEENVTGAAEAMKAIAQRFRAADGQA